MMKNIIFYYFCVTISRIEGVHSVGGIRYFTQARKNGFVPDTTGKKRIYSRNVKRDRQLIQMITFTIIQSMKRLAITFLI